jgi:hypothetical protein
VAGFDLARKRSPESVLEVVTFGAPLVGNDEFAAAYQTLLGDRTVRLESSGDIVPVIMRRWYYRRLYFLRQWLEEREPDDVEEVLVCAIDEVGVPRFPEPDVQEPRTSPRNQELLRRAAALVEELQAQRVESQDVLTSWVEETGGKVIERFWIMNGVLAEVPLRGVPELAQHPEVISIDPRYSGEEPPQDEVAEVGEAGPGNEADIASADHGNAHREFRR